MTHSASVFLLTALFATGGLVSGACAESVSLGYSYYTIGGATPAEIETEMRRKGPKLVGSAHRKAGATRLEFASNIGFRESNGLCHPVSAEISVKARVTLPKWKRPKNAKIPALIFWDVLSGDIEAHEKHHIAIARTHAKRLERAIMALPPAKSCETLFARSNALKDKHLDRHDNEQEAFDRTESRMIEKRILAKLRWSAENRKTKN